MLSPLLALLLPCLSVDRPADLLDERGGRPSLSGPERVLDSDDGAFTIHWTEEGEDAPDPRDADGDGRPDAVVQVLDALQEGAQSYLDLGFRPISPDAPDPAGAIDVYLRVLPINGYATPQPGPEGMSCFLEIDPGLTDAGSVLQSVVVHELHHCVQYGYTVLAPSWIYEAGATAAQYELVQSPTLQGALDVLWNERLRGADRRMDNLEGRFEYAGFLLFKFLSEDGGLDLGRIPRFWEALAEDPSWTAALEAVSPRGADEELLTFHTWNALACARDDGQHYRSDRLPCTLPAISVDIEPFEDGLELTFAEAGSSARYAERPNGDARPLALDCEQDVEGGSVSLALVALTADGVSQEEATGTVQGAGSVALTEPLDPDGSVLVVAVAPGEVPPHLSCAPRRVELPEPPPEATPPSQEDCSCQQGGSGGLTGLLLGALALLRRRRLNAEGSDPTT